MKILSTKGKRMQILLILSLIISYTNQLMAYHPLSFPGNNSTRIIFISFDPAFDSIPLKLLITEGYTVITTYPSLNKQEIIDSLNKADLIIVGRSSTSSDLATYKREWNSLTVPLLLMSQHSSARDKLGWFNSVNVPHLTTSGKIMAYKTQNDTVFYGVNFTSGDTLEWSEKPEDVVVVDSTTNGNVLVRMDSTLNALLMVRFETGIPFFKGSCDRPYAPRTYFATGLNTAGLIHMYPFSDEAKKVWMAEVKHMLATPYTPYNEPLSSDASLSNLILDKCTLSPAFDAETYYYTVLVPDSVSSVRVTPVSASCGSFKGSGNIRISKDSVITEIVVKSEDGAETKTYTILFKKIPSNIRNAGYELIKLYPNPAGDFLDILQLSSYIGGEISLLNIQGTKLITQRIITESLHLDIASLKPGFYFVYVEKNGSSAAQKLEVR